MSEYALVVKGLRKSYGNIRAVDDISFTIRRGSIFSLVGPNGAGKTTTMEIIEGLKEADSGEITLLDMALPKEYAKAKQVMGIQLQTTSLFERLKVGETVNLFRSFYDNPVPAAEVLEAVSLSSKKNQMAAELSGGQQQRLALALALVNDPEIVFLDEPTAGLDPQARREVWRLIQSIKERNRTVFLTTHYMDEAEKLSDDVAIIDHGKIIALDSPRNLVSKLNRENVIEFSPGRTLDKEIFSRIGPVSAITIANSNVVLYTSDMQKCLIELLSLSKQEDFELNDMRFRNPSLEDVFIELTGRMLRE